MSSEGQISRKEKIINNIYRLTNIYDKFFLNKDYLIIAEGQAFKCYFTPRTFKHLCGIKSKLWEKDFIETALNKKLKCSNIYFDRYHDDKTAIKKTEALENILEFPNKGGSILTGIKTNTKDYIFGIYTEDVPPGTLCFVTDQDNTDKNIPLSVRSKYKDVLNYTKEYKIDYVFHKKKGAKKYNKLTYGDRDELCSYISKYDLSDLNLDTKKFALDKPKICFKSKNDKFDTLGDFLKQKDKEINNNHERD